MPDLEQILLALALAAAGALALAHAAATYAPLWPLAAFLGILIACIAWDRRSWPLTVAAFTLACFAYGEFRQHHALEAEHAATAQGIFTAEVTIQHDTILSPPNRQGIRWCVLAAEFAGNPFEIRFPHAEAEPLPAVGERWLFRGYLSPRERPYRRLSICGHTALAQRLTPASPLSPRALAARVRRQFAVALHHQCVHPQEGQLLAALLLSDRRGLCDELVHAFRDSGTAHLFAISGLHVMMIAELLSFMLAWFFRSRRYLGLIILPLIVFYVLIIGESTSAIRAAAMATIKLSAPWWRRRYSSLAAWSLTFLGCHAINPTAITDVGSILSFAVVLAIILFCRLVNTFPSRRQLLLRLIPLVAWATGTPIVAQCFGQIAPVGIPANLLILPLAPLAVGMGALGLLVSGVSSWLSAHLFNMAGLIVSTMSALAKLLSGLPGGSWQCESWHWSTLAAWYIVPIGTLYLLHQHLRKRGQCL